LSLVQIRMATSIFHNSGRTPATAKGTPMYVICQNCVRRKLVRELWIYSRCLLQKASWTVGVVRRSRNNRIRGPGQSQGVEKREREGNRTEERTMNERKAEVGEVYRRLRPGYASEDGGAGLCHAIHACTCKRHTVKPPDSKHAC
jgi:hypothetical protein